MATVVALAGALIGLGASTAQAYPGWTLAGSYGWGDQCLGIGHYGVAKGSWDRYFCEEISPSGPFSPGYYKLWVQ